MEDDDVGLVEAPEQEVAGGGTPDGGDAAAPEEGDRKLVERLEKRIKADKKHHEKAYKRMRRDMKLACRGADKNWPEDAYVANITGRHINQAVAALYAKNPKAIARRAERLDFTVWDENVQTLERAMLMLQQSMLAPPQVDPMTGQPMVDPATMQAQAIVQDFMEGMQRREVVTKTGKTLELLFDYYMREQQPVDFKTAMKQVVRRAKTTGAAFIEIGFQREYKQNYDVQAQISDHRNQIAHMQMKADKLAEDATDSDEGHSAEADKRELDLSMQALQEQEYILIREGLIFDFPESTRVIPDMRTRSLRGFVGARWLTLEYLYSVEEVRTLFGVDLKRDFTAYSTDGSSREAAQAEFDFGEEGDRPEMACVWKHYDRQTGLCYYLCDGHPKPLAKPAAPDVYVESFWPVYALTFNEVEDPDEVFPPSDVSLLYHMQKDYNAARQGQREHRQAARPRFGTPKGMLDDEQKANFAEARPFDVVEFNAGMENADVGKLFQAIPVPGVDPNLYETGQIFTDIQLSVGAQEAQFGAVSKATATESSIAEGSRASSVESNVDDLDNFLSTIARSSGQVMLREMSEEKVMEIVGPGAVWPQMTLDQIASEIFLEIEAGSTGKPNAAQEIANWERMLPFLVQMPSIQPTWLARETLRRLDDRMDLTDAIAEGFPAIVSLNRMSQPSPADPANAPDQQGAEGGDNGPAAPGLDGSDAPMGNNQT